MIVPTYLYIGSSYGTPTKNSFKYVDMYIYVGYVYLRCVGDMYDFGYAHYGVCIPNMYTYPSHLYIYPIWTRIVGHIYSRYMYHVDTSYIPKMCTPKIYVGSTYPKSTVSHLGARCQGASVIYRCGFGVMGVAVHALSTVGLNYYMLS